MNKKRKPKIIIILSIIITLAYLIFLITQKSDLVLLITTCFFLLMSILLIFPLKESKSSSLLATILICATGFNAYTFARPDSEIKTTNYIKNFQGLSYNEVLDYCKENNIEITEKYDYSDYIPKNHIINQSILNENLNNINQIEFLISNGPNYNIDVTIPSLVGENIEVLTNYINSNYLNNVDIKFIDSDTEPNTIISQSITGKMKRNDNILFEVSKSTFTETQMIDLYNMTLFDTKLWLEMNGIKYKTEYDYNDITRGNIFNQSIASGENITEEDTVIIYISKGKSIKVPSLLTMTKDEITKWINDNNLNIEYIEEYNKDYELGKIIKANYNENDTIEEESLITITISKGSLKMINYTNLSDFKLWASDNNIKYEINYSFSDTISKGNLIKCSHSEGDIIVDGETIILTISNGKAVTVPNFKGMKKTDIESKCKALGLNCTFTYYGYTVSTEKDIGVTQNINASKQVTSGTYVKISLSSGIAKTFTIEISETDLVINNASKTIESLKNLFKQKYPGVTFNFETKSSNTYNNAGFIHENSSIKNGSKVTQGKTYTVTITS